MSGGGHSAESGLRPGDAVAHHFHGHGTVTTLSPDRQYAVVRYLTGRASYRRTHRVRDLTRLIPPAEGDA